MNLSTTAIAVLLLGIAGTRMWRRGMRATRLDVILMLLGGFGLTAGLIGEALQTGGEHIGAGISTATQKAFGVGVPLLLIAVMVTLIVIDMRDRTIHVATPFIAMALPTMLGVVGGIYIGAGDTALALIGQAMTTVAQLG